MTSRARSRSGELAAKYGQVMRIGIQNTLVYRANFLIRATFGLIPLLATLSVWRTIYGAGGEGQRVAEYSLSAMVSYYLLVTVVDSLTAVNEDDWQIAADIRDGNISQFLLKPIDYLAYRLCLFLTGRLTYTAAALVPVGLFVWWNRHDLVWPSGVGTWYCFGAATLLTALLQFLVSFTLALLAFWVLEVSTFIFIVFAFEYLAGGHLFPLDILPAGLQSLLKWTPFPYQLYFPVSVYLERLTGVELAEGFAIQVFWVATAYVLARVVWRRGLRKYSAVGG